MEKIVYKRKGTMIKKCLEKAAGITSYIDNRHTNINMPSSAFCMDASYQSHDPSESGVWRSLSCRRKDPLFVGGGGATCQ